MLRFVCYAVALQTLGEQPLEEFFAEHQRNPARLFLLVRHSRVEHTVLWALRER